VIGKEESVYMRIANLSLLVLLASNVMHRALTKGELAIPYGADG